MSEWQVCVNTLDASQARVVARRDNQEDAEKYAEEELDGDYQVLEEDNVVPYPDNGLNFVAEVDVNGLHESPSVDNVSTDEEN
jgi:hypothetical protein